jgi:hypothetical protein
LFSNIKFDYYNNKLSHNFEIDYGLFAIWENANPQIDLIRKELLKNFTVILESKIIWSEANFQDNAARLYEQAIFSNTSKKSRVSGHTSKIGKREFVVFVVKDYLPDYSYNLTVSKKVEITNNNFRKLKYKFREWAKIEGGTNFAVHSTNNINEFFYQAPLLFGVKLFDNFFEEEGLKISCIEKDLEGANGWNTWDDVFKILNVCSNYLVLRSFKDLPHNNYEKDLDLLVENFQKVASLLCMEQSSSKPYKGNIQVANEFVSVDLRFVGDDYYDRNWQLNMLGRKSFVNGFFIPRIDDLFFSLLFHCKIQKSQVKNHYVNQLQELAVILGFDWFNPNLLGDDIFIGTVLGGFYLGNGYYFEVPVDPFVHHNKAITKYLPRKSAIVAVESNMKYFKRKTIQYLPKSSVPFLRKIYGYLR